MAEEPFRVPVLNLLRLAVPAVVVGIVSALTLLGLSRLAGLLEHWIWDDLSAAVGLTSDSAVWIIGVLTATGLLIGLVVRYVPGHAGPDPATLELVAEPLPLRVLPGLALALVLMLAGGVSLGPENPIIGINVGLAVGIGMRFLPKVKAPIWLMMAVAGTIGAMFGTPVAAALLFSELDPGDRRVPLWDRLFPPLVAATAGSLTMMQLEDLDLAVDVPAYTYGGLDDLGLAIAIAVGSALLGLVAVYLFVPMHRLFRRIGHPVLMLTTGGLILGLLGALGGEVTLFKGLTQMQELPGLAATTTALGFLAMAGIKLLAMLVAATSGFRGGRIFPALFVGRRARVRDPPGLGRGAARDRRQRRGGRHRRRRHPQRLAQHLHGDRRGAAGDAADPGRAGDARGVAHRDQPAGAGGAGRADPAPEAPRVSS